MRHHRTAAFAALLLAAAPALAPLHAQRATPRATAAALVAGVPDSAVLAELRFRSIGPAVMSGRISDIAVPTPAPGERWGQTFYVAAAAGGVWKSTDGGVTYDPVFDDVRYSSIGAVAVAPSDSMVVYVGTGESNNLRSSSWGGGVYRSADGGETWTNVGLEKSQHIARIVVHPRDPNTVFVAAMGPLWAAGGERGFYKTTDGGRTWRNTKRLGEHTGFTDIALDPRDPDVIYAATMQRDRRAYSFVAGGPESRVWKSTDGGESWTESSRGLPTGDLGRIGIDIARSRPTTLYATISASGDSSGIYRSDDAGATWTKTNALWSIPWFFGQVRVDPQNPERVYHLGVQLSVSDDGGKTFRSNLANQTHADHHAMWIDPADSDHLMLGNDGGFFTSHDRGGSWDFAQNLPVSTFYAIGADLREPDYWVYGGLQDNGTWGGPSRTRARTGITNADWVRAGGGDGFYAAIDPTDPNVVYVESQNGALSRFDFATQERKSIRPPTEPGDTVRYNWMAPLVISPHDHRTLWFGANVLYRSSDRGDSWTKASGDLTRALNRDSLPIMGLTGPGGFGRHEGTAEFGNLTTIDESPLRAGLVYTGSDDGVVSVTRDGGATWTRITRFPGVPDMTYVSRVVASAHQEGTVYVTLEGHRSNDFRPYVLRSTDYGRTFRSITANLPADAAVYVVREHPRTPNLLFVGTEYGVFASTSGGGSWTQLRNGIAPVPVHDLLIHPRDNDLVVGTHGRGIYILDDITPLQRLAEAGAAARTAVFEPRPAIIRNQHAGVSIFGDRQYRGTSAPAGAVLNYYVAPQQADAASAQLLVVDGQGAVVRTLAASTGPGVHRTTWDLRYDPPVPPPARPPRRGGEEEDETPFFAQAPTGPWVLPGRYTVQLRLGAAGAEQSVGQAALEVRRDPLVRATDAEFRALHDFRMHVYGVQRRAGALTGELEAAVARLDTALQAVDSASAAAGAARAVRADLDSVLSELRAQRRAGGGGGAQDAQRPPVTTRLNGVASVVGGTHFAPTAEQRRTVEEATADLDRLEPRARDALARVDAAVAALAS